MKCRILMVFLLLGLASVNANEIDTKERNGVFVGVEIGAGEGQLDMSIPNLNATMKNSGLNFGAKVGYKYFFNEYFGLRGYGSVNYLSSHYKLSANSGMNGDDSNLSFLDFGANVDLLLNFYNTNNTNFGAFVGVGLGGVSANYKGTFGIDGLQGGGNQNGYRLWDINESKFGLNADVKLGLRLNLLQSHGIEFIAKIPLVANSKKVPANIQTLGSFNIDAKLKPNYTLSLGYLYTF